MQKDAKVIGQLQQAVEQAQTERDGAKAGAVKLELVIADLREQLERAKSSKSAVVESEDFREKYVQVSAQYGELQIKMANMQDVETKKQNETIENLKNMEKNLQDKLEASLESMRKEKEAEIKKIQLENKNLVDDLNSRLSLHSEKVSEMTEKLNEKDKDLASLSLDLENSKKSQKEQATSADSQVSELAKLKDKNEAQLKEIEKMKMELLHSVNYLSSSETEKS